MKPFEISAATMVTPDDVRLLRAWGWPDDPVKARRLILVGRLQCWLKVEKGADIYVDGIFGVRTFLAWTPVKDEVVHYRRNFRRSSTPRWRGPHAPWKRHHDSRTPYHHEAADGSKRQRGGSLR